MACGWNWIEIDQNLRISTRNLEKCWIFINFHYFNTHENNAQNSWTNKHPYNSINWLSNMCVPLNLPIHCVNKKCTCRGRNKQTKPKRSDVKKKYSLFLLISIIFVLHHLVTRWLLYLLVSFFYFFYFDSFFVVDGSVGQSQTNFHHFFFSSSCLKSIVWNFDELSRLWHFVNGVVELKLNFDQLISFISK